MCPLNDLISGVSGRAGGRGGAAAAQQISPGKAGFSWIFMDFLHV